MKLMKIVTVLAIAMTLNAGDFIIKSSQHSVSKTIKNIERIVKSKGMNVFGIINHQAGAKKVGLKMRQAQVIIFGNPKLGTKLMQKDIKAALDLPLKILVYENEYKQTRIEYVNPMEYGNRYALKGVALLNKMTKALDKITTKAGN